MNSERIFKVIGEIDGDLIEGLATCVSPPKNICSIKRISVLAACAFLVVGLGLLVMQNSELFGNNAILTSSTPSGRGYSGSAGLGNSIANSKAASESSSSNDGASGNPAYITSSNRFPSELKPSANLPVLTLPKNPLVSGGMGSEDYMAYSISDLKTENPWSPDENIQVLPVFKRTKDINQAGYTFDADTDAMKKKLTEVGLNFGVYISNTEMNIQNDPVWLPSGSKMVTSGVWAKKDNITLGVSGQLTFEANFAPSIPLPEGSKLGIGLQYDELKKADEYLIKQYRSWLGMQNPETDIEGGDYEIDGKEQNYFVKVFDNSGSIIDKIINYNLYSAGFFGDKNGDLQAIRFTTPDTNNIGNYPIVTSAQAEQLLVAGKCISNSSAEKFPGEQYVRKCELIYRADSLDNILIPYYRFYVEDPSWKTANGMNVYGAYYVPAVEQKYIANMPIHFSVGN